MTSYAPEDQYQHLGKPPWKRTPELVAWETAHAHDVRLDCYLDRCAVAQEALERRAEKAEAAVARVREAHTVYPTPNDPHADQRCTGCIAGYDPRTGELVHCAYPCPTIRALDGDGGAT